MPKHFVFSPLPYTRSEVPLGSFVSNILRPHKGLTVVIPASSDDYDTRDCGDYDGVLKADVANGFFAQITKMLHLSRNTSHNVSLHVSSKRGNEYELKSPETFWKKVLTKDEALRFLAGVAKNRDAWFVTRVRTYIDAHVEVENGEGSTWTIKAEVPAGKIAQMTSGAPIDVGDIGGGIERKWKNGSNESYRADGERIFSIEFHKIIMMAGKEFASASIENGFTIRTHADFRGGVEEGVDRQGEEAYVVGFKNNSETLSAYNDELEELEEVVLVNAEDGSSYVIPTLVDFDEEEN
ncbi:Fc.00g094530.m01.CDS01 [Cosmosporella sp. VM-42]